MKNRRDYILTFLTEFLTLLAGVFVYRLANRLGSSEDFSSYALGRRIVSFIQPLAMVGLAVSVPRFVASAGKNEYPSASVYFRSALKIFGITILILAIVLLPFWRQWQFAFFGEELQEMLLPPLLLMVAGLVLHVIVYGYLRGNFEIEKANFLQLFNIGIVPLLVFFLTRNLVYIFTLTGIIWLTSGVLLIPFKKVSEARSNPQLDRTFKELLNFGLRRIPGDISYAVLFALPTFIVAHWLGIKQAGFLAFGITLVNIAGAAFGPLSLILLPRIRLLALENNLSALKRQMIRFTLLTLVLACSGVFIFELFSTEILTIYLTNPETELIRIARLTVPACIGFSLYVVLRSYPDAVHKKAVNAISIIISLSFFLVLSACSLYWKWPENSIVIAFTLSLSLLGLLTLIAAFKSTSNPISV